MNTELHLVGAIDEYGRPIKTYDDGFGPLWVYAESLGVVGIVRAQSFESAYECVQDEILTSIPESDVIEAYGFYVLPADVFDRNNSKEWFAMRDTGEKLATFDTETEAREHCQKTIAREECELVEGYEYQPNASGTGIVSYDLNGRDLRELTANERARLNIKVLVEQS